MNNNNNSSLISNTNCNSLIIPSQLFVDGLLSIFKFLLFKEYLCASKVNKYWYDTSLKCKSYKTLWNNPYCQSSIEELISSNFNYHITHLYLDLLPGDTLR